MKITKDLLADMAKTCNHIEKCPHGCKYKVTDNSYGEEGCWCIRASLFKTGNPLHRGIPRDWTKQDIQSIYEELADPVEQLINAVKEAEDEDN